jgi:hypothetical protein
MTPDEDLGDLESQPKPDPIEPGMVDIATTMFDDVVANVPGIVVVAPTLESLLNDVERLQREKRWTEQEFHRIYVAAMRVLKPEELDSSGEYLEFLWSAAEPEWTIPPSMRPKQ